MEADIIEDECRDVLWKDITDVGDCSGLASEDGLSCVVEQL